MRINWNIWFLAVLWITAETAHYGWNWQARSDAEMVCDGIGVLMLALAFGLPKQPAT